MSKLYHEIVMPTLKGVGQIALINSALTGALFLIALLIHDSLEISKSGWALSNGGYTLATLLGALSSLAIARLLKANNTTIEKGVYGYNGALVGLACATFFEPSGSLKFVIIAGASCTSILMYCWRWKTPAFTFPFLITIAAIFLLNQWLNLPLTPTILASVESNEVANNPYISAYPFLLSALNGVGQVLFQQGLLFSVIVITGLYLHSTKVGTWAIVGSSMGLLFGGFVGWLEVNVLTLSASSSSALLQGLFGFNGALIALALCQFKGYSNTMILIGTVVASALTWLGYLLGLTLLTFPFVVTAWAMIISKTAIRLTRFKRQNHSMTSVKKLAP
ncbi:urea transporter [Vibrio sp. ZSDE26]|uniref:Urea transporter n=1 Tax=Vibrio amylolyticus TaxID=2847292 RepID=A0A9X1XNB1_9VIBR|nr:urea transporter [Vibrio amylolyticus]MCK6264115.1 urea transporter [Vibrio amylolyticus]